MRNVLIVNDDGIDSSGIRILAEVFKVGCEVTIIAPLEERSCSSHSLTVFRDIKYCKQDERVYAISGTPADCVKIAVIHLGLKPDFVISGINNGPNLGFDVMYSGTVAAAAEAVYLGFAGVALSLGSWTNDELHFKAAANYLYQNKETLYSMAKDCKKEALLNINYPCTNTKNCPYEFMGTKVTKAGINWYDDYYESKEVGILQLKGTPVLHRLESVDCDVNWVTKGYATITPLKIDRNHYDLIEKYKDRLEFR